MNEDEVNEAVAQMRAAFDQLQASGREVALMIGSYHATLLAAGFERQEALELALGYQETALGWLFTPTVQIGFEPGTEGDE